MFFVKRHGISLIAIVFLCVNFSYAETIVQGYIQSETWTKEGNPYILEDSLWVSKGQNLVILPGVEIYGKEGMPIYISGTLIAKGNPDSPILFSTYDKAYRWEGLFIEHNGYADLEYAIIEYAGSLRPKKKHAGGIDCRCSTLIMNYCTLRYNDARMDGGGIYVWFSEFSITNCIFHDNTCYRQGSAITFANYNTPTSKFEYNLIYNNHAEATAAVFIGEPYFTIDHITFYNNTCGEEDGSGDIRVFHWVQAVLTNCIFWGDKDLPGKAIDTRDGGEVLAFYCMSNDSTFKGENIIYGDPQFVDPVRKDFRLLPNSPAINAGDPFYKKNEDGSTTDLGAFQAVSHPSQN